MKNKLCMLLLATGIGLFSCAEKNWNCLRKDSVGDDWNSGSVL